MFSYIEFSSLFLLKKAIGLRNPHRWKGFQYMSLESRNWDLQDSESQKINTINENTQARVWQSLTLKLPTYASIIQLDVMIDEYALDG